MARDAAEAWHRPAIATPIGSEALCSGTPSERIGAEPLEIPQGPQSMALPINTRTFDRALMTVERSWPSDGWLP